MASDSVTSARYRPLIRSAGKPTMTPTTSATSPAAATEPNSGHP